MLYASTIGKGCAALESAEGYSYASNVMYAKPLAKSFFAAAVVFGLKVPYGVFVKLRKFDAYNSRFLAK